MALTIMQSSEGTVHVATTGWFRQGQGIRTHRCSEDFMEGCAQTGLWNNLRDKMCLITNLSEHYLQSIDFVGSWIILRPVRLSLSNFCPQRKYSGVVNK